jgi:hypothetical protein
MDRQLKRMNDLEGLAIVKDFHDHELTQEDPDEFLMWLCKRLSKLIEARHRRFDSMPAEPTTLHASPACWHRSLASGLPTAF